MLLLLIHTAGSEGVVALADETRVLASQTLPGRGTSEALMPAIRRLFPAGKSGGTGNPGLAALTAIAVVNGPGSFTGIRVGLSAAKGLCDGLDLDMIALSRLALVAAASPPAPAEKQIAILDAGRGEFYTGVYENGLRLSEALLSEPETRALLPTGHALTCEPRVAEKLAVSLIPEPTAEAIRHMAIARIAANQWSDPATTDANYLRRTDAEILINP